MKRTLSILFAVVAILSMMVLASASVEAATLKTPAVTKTEGVANGIKLTWDKVSGAAKYRVFLHNGTTWKKLADTTATNYTYTKVKSGSTYKFTVRCISKDGKKFTSNYNKSGYSVKWVAVPKLKTANTVANGITVQWNASKGASKYRLFYKTAGSSWKKIGDTTATKLTYTGAAYNTDYTFTVRPVSNNGKVFEGYYNTKGLSFRRLTIPAVFVKQSGDNAVISWNKVNGAAKYRVFYKADGSGWKKIADTTSTAYTYSGMQKNKPYTFTVRTISADAKRYTSYYDSKGASLTILNTGLDDGLVEATEPATEPATEAATVKPTEAPLTAPTGVTVSVSSTGKRVYEKVAKYGIKTNLNTNTDTRMIEVNNSNTFFWQSFVTGEKYIDSYIEYLSNGNVRIHFTPNSPDKITKMEGWFYGESGTWYSFNIPTSTLKNGSGYYDYHMPELTAQRVNPSVKVSWGSSSNADGYDVTIKNASGKAASQTVHVGKNATSATISLNTADSGSYTAEVKAIKGIKSKSATRSFSLKAEFVAESEASTIKVPVVFPNARFVCNRCGRNVSGKVKNHIIPIDSTELRERYADSLYTYKYKPTAGTNNAWVAAWAGTPDVTLTAGYYDLGDYYFHPYAYPDEIANWICDDSIERDPSMPTMFSLAELQEKINNCGNQTYINLGTDFWLNSPTSVFHSAIEGCSTAYHEEDCVSISGLQTVVIPATGYTRVTVG